MDQPSHFAKQPPLNLAANCTAEFYSHRRECLQAIQNFPISFREHPDQILTVQYLTMASTKLLRSWSLQPDTPTVCNAGAGWSTLCQTSTSAPAKGSWMLFARSSTSTAYWHASATTSLRSTGRSAVPRNKRMAKAGSSAGWCLMKASPDSDVGVWPTYTQKKWRH